MNSIQEMEMEMGKKIEAIVLCHFLEDEISELGFKIGCFVLSVRREKCKWGWQE